MNILFIILFSIIGLIALVILLAIISKKEYEISRNIVINKPVEEVFSYIKFLQNQNYYNKWWMFDPHAKKGFRGTDGTIGFVATWDSQNKQAGAGEQEITNITLNKRLDTEIRFFRPFKNTAHIYMLTESTGANQTKVTWVFTGKNKVPMNLMNSMISKMLGKDFEESIQNLKNIVEKNE